MDWKLWYEESTFSSADGGWEDAPHRGVLLLVTPDPDVGREFDWGPRGEFYAWWPGASKPWGFDRVGILDYLVEIGWPASTRIADLSLEDWNGSGVKLGRSVDNPVFRNRVEAATNDPDFQPKSALGHREQT